MTHKTLNWFLNHILLFQVNIPPNNTNNTNNSSSNNSNNNQCESAKSLNDLQASDLYSMTINFCFPQIWPSEAPTQTRSRVSIRIPAGPSPKTFPGSITWPSTGTEKLELCRDGRFRLWQAWGRTGRLEMCWWAALQGCWTIFLGPCRRIYRSSCPDLRPAHLLPIRHIRHTFHCPD